MSISPRILFTSKGAVLPVVSAWKGARAIETGDIDVMTHVGTTGTWAANYAWYAPIFVPCKVKIDGVIIRVYTSSGNIDLGIYNQAGQRLVSSGSIACPAAGFRRIALTEITVGPGWIIAAIAINNATASFYFTGVSGITMPTGYEQMGYQASAFPLPATASITWDASRTSRTWMRFVHS